MVGVVFNGLDGKPAKLNEILEGEFQDGDVVQVYAEGGDYRMFSYWKEFGGWLDGSFNVASDPLPLGTAFWLQTPSKATSVILKGAVHSGEYKYAFKPGLQMVALGIPKTLDLNADVLWEGFNDGDTLQVHKDGDYTLYSYWKDYGGWLDGSFAPASTPLPIGASIWVQTASTEATLTVPSVVD